MSAENVQIVTSIYQALERGDIPGMVAALDAEFVMHEPQSLPYGGTYRGPDGFLQALATIAEYFSNVKLTVTETLDAGDTVVALVHVQGQGASTGQPFEMHISELWRLKAGRVVALHPFYWDTAKVLETLHSPQTV